MPAAKARPFFAGKVLIVVSLILLAFNLRPAVNALGVVVPELQAATGLDDRAIGWLTGLPTLSFAVMGFGVSIIARRLGTQPAVILSLVALAVGQVIRATGGTAALFIGSAIALAAITFGNVLLPSLVQRYFPHAVGPMTALYTTSLMIGQTLGAGITVPLEQAWGGTWRLGIGMWAATAVIALIPWLLMLRRHHQPKLAQTTGETSDSRRAAGTALTVARLARTPRAWIMAAFFGLQSLQAYVVFGWVPVVLTDAGLTKAAAGVSVAIATALSIPISALVPSLLARTKRHEVFVVIFVVALAVAYAGLLTMPLTATWLQAALIGVGFGLFPTALTLLTLRARTEEGTTALSGFSQSVGYLIASIGPVGFGMLRDASGASTLPLIGMLITLVPMLLAGLYVVRPWHIEDGVGD